MPRVLTAAWFAVAVACAADYPVHSLPIANVQIRDEFWTPRIDNNRSVTLPHLLDRVNPQGPIEGRLLEAAAYVLMQSPDPALRDRVNNMLDGSIRSMRQRKGLWPNRGDGPFFSTGH